MVKRILNWLVLAPLALVAVVLAVANRGMVTLSADPFTRETPFLTVSLPLFVIIFAAVILGVVMGGAAVWLNQGQNRKRARRAEADLANARAETERLRTELAKGAPPAASPSGLPVVFDRTAAA